MFPGDSNLPARPVLWLLGLVLLLLPAGSSAFETVTGNIFAHDPSRLIKDGNRYYYFRTSQGIESAYSTDLRNWTYAGRIFPGSPPSWTTNAVPSFTGHFWAPDVAYFNGKYHVYYSVSEWGTINSAIGLVTSPSLINPVWTDHGKVIQSDAVWEAGPDTDLTANNCIDPAILIDTNGSIWMVFGSYSDGILVMQLDPATGKRISPGSPITRIANNGPNFFSNTTEAAMIFQRGGFYYLFLNFGGCCSGVDSTYNIRVGRSASVTGPYLDRNGVNMNNGGGTMVLESTGRFVGPGHAGILEENGTNWFTYHYYDCNENGVAKFGLAQLFWTDDGWPSITNDWSAFYTFDVDAREHRAVYNGSLRNGAMVVNDPDRGGVLNLNGTGNYVTLPNSVANANTFAAWVKWNGGADWQRIFDFGSNTTRYAVLTPRASSGKMRFTIRIGGSSQIVEAPAALPTNAWTHVALALDGSRGSLYMNGNLVASSNNITIRPWQLLARSNYVGKSQFATDPMFHGQIDSFRIFGRTLSEDEIRELAWAHPSLAHRYSFNYDGRDSIGMAHGKVVGNAVVTNETLRLPGTSGSYMNLPGGLVSGSSALSVEFWASFGVNGVWSRVFDFGNMSGNNGQNYVFFSPRNNSGGQRLEISTAVRTSTLDVPTSMDNRSLHVVCIVDPADNYCAIYTNGVLQTAQITLLPPLSGVSSAWAFIGRSLWSSDGWLNASIDEFRIYDGRLNPDEIIANYVAGPDALALPMSLTHSISGSDLVLRWPAYAAGYELKSTSSLNDADWSSADVTPVLSNNEWRVTIPVNGEAQFFRLQR
mgnify:CR=1 FL=1